MLLTQRIYDIFSARISLSPFVGLAFKGIINYLYVGRFGDLRIKLRIHTWALSSVHPPSHFLIGLSSKNC